MSGPAPFRQSDLTRALKGALKAGLDVARAEVDPRTGRIAIYTPAAPEDGAPPDAYEEWKASRGEI